jgi:hypothetical protein
MNTLDDLRRTLDAHAGDVRDDVTHARTAAVRGRAAVVRRRRAAGVGAAAALAVVGALVGPTLVSDTDPQLAERTLIGEVAPATMQSLGYTYRFAEGVAEEDGDASIRLRPSDRPRLVTWASAADDVTVRSTQQGGRATSSRTDFDDFAYVHPQESGRWTVRAGGEPTAVAVYELDEEVTPAGTTVADDLTFRQTVGDEELLAAGALGADEVVLTVRATVPETERMRVAEFCAGVPTDGRFRVNLSVDGAGAVASGGCDLDAFDPATGDATWLEDRHLPEPGEQVEVRMWVARELEGGPIRLDGARLAIGLYEVAEPAAVVGGWETAGVVEHAGHVWALVGTREATAGDVRAVAVNEGTAPLLAIGSYERPGGVVRIMTSAGDGLERSSVSTGGSSTIGVLAPGETARMSTRTPLGPRGAMGIALYEQVD